MKRADLNRRGVKSFPTPGWSADLRAHTLMVDLLQRLNLTSKVRLNYERALAVYRNLFLGQKLCPPATKPYKFAGCRVDLTAKSAAKLTALASDAGPTDSENIMLPSCYRGKWSWSDLGIEWMHSVNIVRV